MESVKSVCVRRVSNRARLSAAALAVLAGAAPVLATPPSMTAITFPINIASVATQVVAAGAALLLAYFGVKVGFAFAKKLLARLHKAV